MTTVAEYLAGLPEHQRALASELVTLLDTGLPETTGQLWHGHPVWLAEKQPIAGFKGFPRYLTFMLWQGQKINDDSGLLTPSGSAQMAVLKLSGLEELNSELLSSWISQIARL